MDTNNACKLTCNDAHCETCSAANMCNTCASGYQVWKRTTPITFVADSNGNPTTTENIRSSYYACKSYTCDDQVNCAASTANACSTTAGITTKAPCTSVTAAGYALDGDKVVACVDQANCATSTPNTCSTTAGIITKTPCTLVTDSGYYLVGDKVVASTTCSLAVHINREAGDVCTACACGRYVMGTCLYDCTTLTTCGANTFDTDNNPANGCEEGCTTLAPDSTCTACTSPALNGCTAVTCDAATSTRWRYDSNGT